MHSGDECNCNNIITTVIYWCHLVLKITDVALESLSLLHLNDEEVVVVLLKLLPRGILVEEGVINFLKDLERL